MGSLLKQWSQQTEKQKRRFWFLFVIGIELLTVVMWWGKRPIPPDYITYARMADVLASGQGYLDQGQAFTFFPPGYPIFLMVIHALADVFSLDRTLTVIGIDLLIGAFSLLYFRKIARHFLPEVSAEIATLLWATYPIQLLLYTQPNSEIPFLLTFLAALSHYLTYLRKGQVTQMAIGGFWLGISCLLRPITLYLAVILVIYVLWYNYQQVNRRHSLGTAIALWLSGFCLTVLPWELYVYHYNHEWIMVQGKSVLAIYEGLIFGHKAYHGSPISVPKDLYDFMDKVASAPPTLPSLFQKVTEAQPLVLLQLLGYKLLRSWYGLWDNPNEKSVMVLQFLYLIPATAGIIRSFSRRYFSWFFFIPLLLILYYWGTTLIIIPLLRYMIPAMPFVMLYIAFLFVKKPTIPAESRS
ncbi:hypothetical protein BWI96_06470 [Siphonobacter sp. SORGH_AS_0500]|uniref:glycosyltransferase family 39 protein n=1 Tax=Siphonobacter sp. SORGH_AS_0500 TaxID=1864824 RepID=UPI000CAA37E3|nr:glycosyltransferase family 39 protein [Siphonobacter sp. SORGH_AS_0500]PKK37504.1 hypothetical protein BWI96_06470 [Siphonobacter sp. SORGH_AS_0500]